MTKSTLPQEAFEKVLRRLTEFVVLGKAHLNIGRGLAQKMTADPVIAHVAPVFWSMSINAHIDVAQLIAFKLFDTRVGTMTIEYLLERAAECSNAFHKATPDQITAIIGIARKQIAGLASPLTSVRAKRNRFLAHLDPTIVRDPERLAKECQVTFSDLNLIFETAGSILNEVSVGYNETSTLFELIDEKDYEWAVQLIVDAKHQQVDDYEKEFKAAQTFLRPQSPRSRTP